MLCVAVWSASAGAAIDLVDGGVVRLPICARSLVDHPPAGVQVDIAPAQCGPFGPGYRPPGQIAFLASTPAVPDAEITIGQTGTWTLRNLRSNLPLADCQGGYVNSPYVMGCSSAAVDAQGNRSGVSFHWVASIHDAERPIGDLSTIVSGPGANKVRFVAIFSLRYGGDGPRNDAFYERLRERFELRVFRRRGAQLVEERIATFTLGYETLTLQTSQRIAGTVEVAEGDLLTARLVFVPTSTRTITTNGLQTGSSEQVQVSVALSELSMQRGGLPRSLHEAVRDNDIEGTRALLTSGAPINAVDAAGITALSWAEWLGFASIAEILSEAGATDNRVDILATQDAEQLIKVAYAGVPAASWVSDILMRRKVTPFKAQDQPTPPQKNIPMMSFTASAQLRAGPEDDCPPEDRSLDWLGAVRVDEAVKGMACSPKNPLAGFFAGSRSVSVFHVLRLESRPPEVPGTFGRAIYSASILSGAYGGNSYNGLFPFGSSSDQKASVRYALGGKVELPVCSDVKQCNPLVAVWFETKQQGEGMSTQVTIEQAGKSIQLIAGKPLYLDLTQSHAVLHLQLARYQEHVGGRCCERVMELHDASVYVSQRKRSENFKFAATHGAAVDKALSVSRQVGILQVAQAILRARGTRPDSDSSVADILTLASTHDSESHPHVDRHADLYLRLALLDYLQKDSALSLTAIERHTMGRVITSLAQDARSLYYTKTQEEFTDLRDEVLMLRAESVRTALELLASAEVAAAPPAAMPALDALLAALPPVLLFKARTAAKVPGAVQEIDAAVALLREYLIIADAQRARIQRKALSLAYELAQFAGSTLQDDAQAQMNRLAKSPGE